jgi:hypothetical protein
MISSADNAMVITATPNGAPIAVQGTATSTDAIILVLQTRMKDIQASQQAWMIAAIIAIIALIFILSAGVAMLRFTASKIDFSVPT